MVIKDLSKGTMMPQDFIENASDRTIAQSRIDRETYVKLNVKRGLRNEDGSGVLTGLSRISSVQGTQNVDGKVSTETKNQNFTGGHEVY